MELGQAGTRLPQFKDFFLTEGLGGGGVNINTTHAIFILSSFFLFCPNPIPQMKALILCSQGPRKIGN